MLKAHMDAIEKALLCLTKIPANAGHPLHLGTPREIFIREFLENNLNTDVAIGTGEIIDANSKPNPDSSRNQYDIVIYKKNFPKLNFGGGINGFFIESVIATIEVKSTLDKTKTKASIIAAHNAKRLTCNFNEVYSAGWIPPKILNYIVAYDCNTDKIGTVLNWITDIHKQKNISFPEWTQDTRIDTAGTALDGVFLLGKGFIKLDNTPLSLNENNTPGIHTVVTNQDGNLLMLFLALLEACNNVHGAWINPKPYMANVNFTKIDIK